MTSGDGSSDVFPDILGPSFLVKGQGLSISTIHKLPLLWLHLIPGILEVYNFPGPAPRSE